MHAGAGCEFGLEVVKIHLVAAIGKPELVGDNLAAVLLYHREEGVVNRFLEDYFIPGVGQGIEGGGDGRDDTGGKHDPFRFDFPAEFGLQALHH